MIRKSGYSRMVDLKLSVFHHQR